MNKKIISCCFVLSATSLFSIGFSSWEIVEQNNKSSLTNTFAPEAVNIFTISDVGISKSEKDIGKFIYYIDLSNGEDEKEYLFSSTNLTFTIVADKKTFKTLDYDNDEKYYLELEIFYEKLEIIYENNNYDFDLFTNNSVFITPPEETEIGLTDVVVEKLKTPIIASNEGNRYSLNTKIPIKSTTEYSLYNIVSVSSMSSVSIDICFPFSYPTDLLKNNFSTLDSLKFYTTLNVCSR